jgi:hypothetical protein
MVRNRVFSQITILFIALNVHGVHQIRKRFHENIELYFSIVRNLKYSSFCVLVNKYVR